MQLMYRECVHVCSFLNWFSFSRLSRTTEEFEEKEAAWGSCPSVSSACTYYEFAWRQLNLQCFCEDLRPRVYETFYIFFPTEHTGNLVSLNL